MKKEDTTSKKIISNLEELILGLIELSEDSLSESSRDYYIFLFNILLFIDSKNNFRKK